MAGTRMWLAKPPSMSLPGIFWSRQMVPLPALHSAQVPHGITAGTMTARPCQDSAPAPHATTRPLISWPSVKGNGRLVRTPS